MANNEQANRVWLNNGTGTFTSGQALETSDNWGVSLGDLDGDGDLDAFVAKWPDGTDRVWLNDGTGHFTGTGQALGDSYSFGVSLNDLDGDGDLDAIVANDGEANRVWINENLYGDYNRCGIVDAADYIVWRKQLGQSFTLPNENPAAATPGHVDQQDYDFWRANYGNTVPETLSASLVADTTSSDLVSLRTHPIVASDAAETAVESDTVVQAEPVTDSTRSDPTGRLRSADAAIEAPVQSHDSGPRPHRQVRRHLARAYGSENLLLLAIDRVEHSRRSSGPTTPASHHPDVDEHNEHDDHDRLDNPLAVAPCDVAVSRARAQ